MKSDENVISENRSVPFCTTVYRNRYKQTDIGSPEYTHSLINKLAIFIVHLHSRVVSFQLFPNVATVVVSVRLNRKIRFFHCNLSLNEKQTLYIAKKKEEDKHLIVKHNGAISILD